jgi:hypothetical protein
VSTPLSKVSFFLKRTLVSAIGYISPPPPPSDWQRTIDRFPEEAGVTPVFSMLSDILSHKKIPLAIVNHSIAGGVSGCIKIQVRGYF